MPDITMCDNESCPKRYSCYRYMAIPSERQSWATFDGDKDCSRYWPTGGILHRNLRLTDLATITAVALIAWALLYGLSLL